MLALLRTVLDEDQANLIFCMLISIPISYLLKIIKQKYLFLALSMTVTLAFQTFLFPNECYFLWIQQQIVYFLVLFAPRKHVGHYILVQSFLALAFIQIRRIFIAYGVNGVDITGIFMMQLFVWVGMGYNYQNGNEDPANLTHDQKRRSIKQRPNYITYIGYVNFLPACLIGPVYQFNDYNDYLHRVHDYVHIPSPLISMAKQAAIFICSLVLYFATGSFKIQDLITEWYAAEGISYKLVYVMIIVFNIQLRYISAWSLGMISMKASGFTYNPTHNHTRPDGTVDYNFDKVKVTDMKKFFLSSSLKIKAEGWNVSVQVALKRYIYQQWYNPTKTYHSEKERKKRMNQATLITMLTSGLWHGFYPSYFVTFFHWSLCLQMCAQFWKFRTRHKKLKQLWEKYPIFDVIQNLIWTFCIAYFGAPVPLLVWEKFKLFLSATYYLPFVILYIAYFLIMQMRILSKFLPKQQGHHLDHKDKKQNGKQTTQQTQQKDKLKQN